MREYLQAHIKASLLALEKAAGIDEYQEQCLDRIQDFVATSLHQIPTVVENVPIVALHSDLGLHNVMVSSDTCTDVRAIIDWEFLACAPYATSHPMIERLFRKPALNMFGPEYERADELREAFWGAIPDWQRRNQSEATQVFMEWFLFGYHMRAPWRPSNLPEDEAKAYWQENFRAVNTVLNKYS